MTPLFRHARHACFFGLLALAALVGCQKLTSGGALPTPTPTGSPTGAPGVCGTPNPSSANLVIVAMGSAIGATAAPTYGPIGGYAVADANSGTFPDQAQIIDQWIDSSGTTQPITAQDVLQFTNVESGGSPIDHSAVGFAGDAFPNPQTYVFPTAAASPAATAVSTTALWSTGRIPAATAQQCFSQTFTLTPGTYYFGDLDYYGITTFRDVLIVAPSSARSRKEGSVPRAKIRYLAR